MTISTMPIRCDDLAVRWAVESLADAILQRLDHGELYVRLWLLHLYRGRHVVIEAPGGCDVWP